MGSFRGFPPGALAWFSSVAGETQWARVESRRAEHEAALRVPMAALCDELSDEFGDAYVWHLHRAPYLWHTCAAVVAVADNVGYEVRLTLDDLTVVGGWVTPSSDQVSRFRAAVVGPAGADLDRDLADLRGFTVAGPRLARPPRGVPGDHPRADLARYRGLSASRSWAAGDWLGDRRAVRRVRDGWRALRPLVGWLTVHVGPRQR